VKGDKYYGDAARSYDADRCHTMRWAREQQAINDFVFSGPVLDIPLGTARYAQIYKEKGLDFFGIDISEDMLAVSRKRYPDIKAEKGNILSLAIEPGRFDTAVCTRLLDWLSPDEMPRAVAALLAICRVVIVSIRTGPAACRINYTHPMENFYAAIDGWHIGMRRVTEITRDGKEEIFRLSRPVWQDVMTQFHWHGHTPTHEMARLANEALAFAGRAELPMAIGFSEECLDVSAEYWTSEKIGKAVNRMARINPAFMTDEKPRFGTDWSATVMEYDGLCLILDGRRRMNAWSRTPGRYPFLVLRPKPLLPSSGTADRRKESAGGSA
jgi:SAM-dependent methyltransferase